MRNDLKDGVALFFKGSLLQVPSEKLSPKVKPMMIYDIDGKIHKLEELNIITESMLRTEGVYPYICQDPITMVESILKIK